MSKRDAFTRYAQLLPIPRIAGNRKQSQIAEYKLEQVPPAHFQHVVGRGIEVSLQDSWAVLGIKGSGKTMFAKKLFSELTSLYPGTRRYILDSKQQGEFDDISGAHYLKIDRPPDPLHHADNLQVWQPPVDNIDMYSAWFESILKAGKPAIVLVDEISSICGRNGTVYPLGYGKMLKQGRGLEQCLISLTQEAAYIPRQLIGQMTHFIRFHLIDEHDQKKAMRILQHTEVQEPSGPYGFYHKNVQKNGPTNEYRDMQQFFNS